MQGPAVGRQKAPRYYCSTRRVGRGCDQPLIHADKVETQLVEFVSDFKPAAQIRDEVLRRLFEDASADSAEARRRRDALEERLRRLRDLYELGDLTKPEYVARRAAIQEELAALAPEPAPNIELGGRVLDDFDIFWRIEEDPDAKRELLRLIFERVWLDNGRVVAVRPNEAFAPFFVGGQNKTAAKAVFKGRERRDSNPRPPA
jgi:hypothetical protein